MPARGQKQPENEAATQQTIWQESAERTRIASERAALISAYEAQRSACYQKLAVSDCLTQARDAHNDQMRDLKRQDVALNDVQRKRKAAERMRAVDERNSPESQLKLSERRGRAIEEAKQREINRAERQTTREAKSKEATTGAQASGTEPPTKEPIQNTKMPRSERQPKLPVEQRPGQAEKAAKSQQAAAQRERDEAKRRAKAEQREVNRKKPAAAGLPVPQ